MTADIRQLRSFGLIVGAGFGLIGLAPLLSTSNGVRTWALIVALALIGSAAVFPRALEPLHRRWMQLAEVLAWVNTRIILFAVFYAVIVPIGAVLRITGKDPLQLKFAPDDPTYRIVRPKRPPTHMHRQF
jgi:hypothetical protein